MQYTPDRRSIRKIPAYSWFLTISHLRVDGQVCIAHYLSSTPRVQAEAWEIIKRRFAAPPHGSFTPAAVLTEPPPLLETVAGREYHCHSDCHRHTGGNPILAEGFLARPGKPGSWRTLLLWLALSRIGTDVLDEWVFVFKVHGGRVTLSPPYYNIRGPKANLFF